MLHEENIILKPLEDIDVRIGIIFPDYYENSLLSLGYQIIYYMLNERNDCFCERIVFPHTKSKVGELIMNKSYDSPLSEWENYFPRYEIGDELPWDCINLGYRDSFIPRKHRKMLKAKTTQWCGESPCYNCKDNCDDNPFV